jgi:hypothetical protein
MTIIALLILFGVLTCMSVFVLLGGYWLEWLDRDG